MPERNQERELRALMDTLAESLVGASDAEVLEEARNTGEDVEGTAESLRARLLGAIVEYRQRHLKAARAEYEGVLAAIERPGLRLPDTAEKRRALLDAVLASNPAVGSLLTAQYRDLTSLPDADVEGCLRHLQILGILDKLQASQDEG